MSTSLRHVDIVACVKGIVGRAAHVAHDPEGVDEGAAAVLLAVLVESDVPGKCTGDGAVFGRCTIGESRHFSASGVRRARGLDEVAGDAGSGGAFTPAFLAVIGSVEHGLAFQVHCSDDLAMEILIGSSSGHEEVISLRAGEIHVIANVIGKLLTPRVDTSGHPMTFVVVSDESGIAFPRPPVALDPNGVAIEQRQAISFIFAVSAIMFPVAHFGLVHALAADVAVERLVVAASVAVLLIGPIATVGVTVADVLGSVGSDVVNAFAVALVAAVDAVDGEVATALLLQTLLDQRALKVLGRVAAVMRLGRIRVRDHVVLMRLIRAMRRSIRRRRRHRMRLRKVTTNAVKFIVGVEAIGEKVAELIPTEAATVANVSVAFLSRFEVAVRVEIDEASRVDVCELVDEVQIGRNASINAGLFSLKEVVK